MPSSVTPGTTCDNRSKGGTQVVWLVRPKHRTITVFRPDLPEVVLHESDVLDGGDVLPGFELPLIDLFSVLDSDEAR